jgi:transcriptional regulator with XRE-family HTH domain
VAESEEARKAHEEFLARIALQQKLIQMRKAENMTQADVAKASGLSQQAVSRIERGAGATIDSLIKYLTGIGYSIQFKKM